jgi:hypothetical protein
MDDGNMHWVAAMQKLDGMSTFTAGQHFACAMAKGYHLATGKVASAARSTCGWGVPASQLHHHL